MKYLVIGFITIIQTLAFGQQKGASPIINATITLKGQTYAVVVGISDYQDPRIPDLRFADKDAEAFANFLRSPAGGSLDGDHLKVLTNQKATAGRLAEALDNLIEQANEGDVVIFYFSGHGDVEGKKISQPGFLLCWDAPSQVYMGGGTYSLSFLQEVVTTLSVQNKAKVVVVTDACHAGKLAGSQIGGSQLTAANLAKQYANEVKILSCQPGEFSLEGEQWGGGRGVFSYYLVDGLLGLADRNVDGVVSLGEIDRYLEDHVTAETAPLNQVPMLLGNKTEQLAAVNAGILAGLKKNKAAALPVFMSTDGRGFEDEILAKVDTIALEQYLAFKKAVAEKRFFTPENNCAELFYAKLSQNEAMTPLYGLMKRNYSAALQDDAQQWLNSFLKDPKFGKRQGKMALDLVRPYPHCLARAAELLGEKHYMYPVLRARQHFFEGKVVAPLSLGPDSALGQKALSELRTSLTWQPDQPHVIMRIGQVFQFMYGYLDSAETYYRHAAELAPAWVLPLTQLALLCYSEKKQPAQAKLFLEQAEKLDSSSVDVAYWWSQFYESQNDFVQAERYYKKAIRLDPGNNQFRTALGMRYLEQGQFEAAQQILEGAIEIDSTDAEPLVPLGVALEKLGNPASAEKRYLKATQLDPMQWEPFFKLGILYVAQHRNSEAEHAYLEAIRTRPGEPVNYYNLACLKSTEGEPVTALTFLERAFSAGFADFDWMLEDPDLASLRSLPEWKVLIKKHFPDKVKD